MTARPLVLLSAVCCGLLGVLLVAVEQGAGGAAKGAAGVVCALLVVATVGARVALGMERRRERRALRDARTRLRATAQDPAAGGRRTVAAAVLLAAGVLVGLLALRSVLGVSVWALVLLGAGGFVLWAQTAELPAADATGPTSGWQRLVGRRPGRRGQRAETDGLLLASGIGLVVLGALVALSSLGALDASRTSVVQLLVAVAAVGVVVAPFWRRSARRAQAERSERIRGDERAEVGAHLHDSVLQTLALIQRRSDDPREVAGLARRQERELRAWLSGRSERPDTELMAALRAAAAAVEVEHGVEIEVVTSGELPLDDGTAALVAAAREAMANAARHAAPGPDAAPVPVSVFAEVDDGRVEVFVRDRGRGFDPETLPADRRGVRESIVGRMRRAGGRATITSAPGEGTEVELLLEDRP
ncbi:sensor histidine kinase [Patulibacter sp.]|uniref:sensor histidine kinase n=1 Tax=Patulibacter sp. TaxID=1912859 RepID=UPI0027258AC0|nr:ATP-binding protein [Patulibacter sp.]MDO9409669.1 ATP-binding protein [Patulibacter sp.]